jgi:hypothetical protein
MGCRNWELYTRGERSPNIRVDGQTGPVEMCWSSDLLLSALFEPIRLVR